MKINRLFFYTFCVLCLVQCKKNVEEINTSNTQNDSTAIDIIDPKLEDFLSSQESVDKQLKDAVFPNGQNLQDFMDQYRKANGLRSTKNSTSPEAKKRYFIGVLIEKGLKLSDKKTNIFSDNNQVGIAYSLGAKDYIPLSSPTSGTCNTTLKFHGIDCSGFVYQLALMAGIDLGDKKNLDAEAQSKEKLWQDAIHKKGNDYALIGMKDVTNTINNRDYLLETGDIIFFKDAAGSRASHVGIIWRDKSNAIYFISSRGSGYKNCAENITKKGPSVLSINTKSYFGNAYSVLRFDAPPDLSDTPAGKIDVAFKCDGTDPVLLAMKYYYKFTVHTQDSYDVTKVAPFLNIIHPNGKGFIRAWLSNLDPETRLEAKDSKTFYGHILYDGNRGSGPAYVEDIKYLLIDLDTPTVDISKDSQEGIYKYQFGVRNRGQYIGKEVKSFPSPFFGTSDYMRCTDKSPSINLYTIDI